LTLAEADLFAEGKDKDHVSKFLEKNKIITYIDRYTKKKYHAALKQLIDRACHLCILGFSSFNLLMARKQYDKDMDVSSPYEPKDILSSEKNKIVNLVATLAKAKTSSTKAGLIATMQIEIMSDVEHLREKFQSIEMALLKKKKEELEYELEVFSKKPLDEIKEKNIFQQIFSEKNALEERVKTLEKNLEIVKHKHAFEIKTRTENFQDEKKLLESKIHAPAHSGAAGVKYRKKMLLIGTLAVTGILLTSLGLGAIVGIPLLLASILISFGIVGMGGAGIVGYALYSEHHPERKPFLPVSFFKKPLSKPLEIELKVLAISK